MPKNKCQWMQCINFRWKLYQRSGTWYADGRPNRGRYSLATSDETEARQRVTQLDQKMAQRLQNKAEDEPAGKPKPIGIHEGWERYIEHGNRPTFLGGHSPATTKKYREMQRRSAEYFKSQDILWWLQLKPKHLTDFAKAFEKKLSPRTLHHEITMHASVCNWLIREELLDQKYKLKTDLQKPEGSEAFCYTEKQVTSILEHCYSQRSLQQMGLFCHLLSHTGLRLGEAISLKWRDVDFDQGFLTVRDERFASQPSSNRRRVKNGSTRRVPLAKSLREQLLKCKSRRPNAWVFPNRTGGQLMANNLRDKFVKDVIKPLAKRFEAAGEGEELEEGRFHSFRHYFVSQCFLKGINEGTIRSWVGHRDSKIVELYRHLAVADSKRLMEQLEFTGEASES